MVHELKTWMPYFQEVCDHIKTFEVRNNDRNFNVGDYLELHEWNQDEKVYTGRKRTVYVSTILHGGQFGIEEGYCVMSIQ